MCNCVAEKQAYDWREIQCWKCDVTILNHVSQVCQDHGSGRFKFLLMVQTVARKMDRRFARKSDTETFLIGY